MGLTKGLLLVIQCVEKYEMLVEVKAYFWNSRTEGQKKLLVRLLNKMA